MSQNGRKFITRVVFLFVLGLAAYYFYLTYVNPPVLDYTSMGNKLDQALDQVLVSRGIANKDIVKVYREEKKLNSLTWIQTTKSIRLSRDVELQQLAGDLAKAVTANGARVLSLVVAEDGNALTLKAGIRDIILESLFLKRKELLKKYRAAIVIDDLGYDKKVAQELIALKEPLTFSILPGERYSREIANLVTQAGYEVLLHQPMEPLDYPKDNPGKRAILMNMSPQQVRAMMVKNISDVPYVDGVNNHMGSRVTEDETKMGEVLAVVKEHKLFFVDSRTSTKSVAYKTARKMGVRASYNMVFLDNENNVDYVKKQLDKAVAIALKNGKVVAIGHCERKETLAALREKLPEFLKLGIEIVPVSQLVE
jgi:uncharacterized protein